MVVGFTHNYPFTYCFNMYKIYYSIIVIYYFKLDIHSQTYLEL